jgi:hypothetical protein
MNGTTRRTTLLLMLVAGRALAAPEPAGPDAEATTTCRPAADVPVKPAPGRRTQCVIDIGSRNVKLVVASVEGNDPRSIIDERQCQTRLRLGDKTFDPVARAGRPLGPADRDALAVVVSRYVARCGSDGGKISGALATEWARRATNIADIRGAVLARTGIEMEVLAGDREGRYGYHAATRGARGKLVVDFGSRSVQLSYWPQGAPGPSAIALPLGIDEAGDRFFGKPQHHDYRSARTAFQAAVRGGARRFLEKVRADIKRDPHAEIFSLAENGDVALATAGQLWPRRQAVTVEEYGVAVRAVQRKADPGYGPITGALAARELDSLVAQIDKDRSLFEALRGDQVNRTYGYKMLAFPALITMLARELGVRTVVLVPQEMADGLIVDRMVPHSLAARP